MSTLTLCLHHLWTWRFCQFYQVNWFFWCEKWSTFFCGGRSKVHISRQRDFSFYQKLSSHFSKNNKRLTVWTSLIHTWLDIRNSIHLIKPFIQDERSPFFTLRPSWVSFFFSFPLLPFENKDDNFIFINYFVLFFDCCTFHDVLIIFEQRPMCSPHFIKCICRFFCVLIYMLLCSIVFLD